MTLADRAKQIVQESLGAQTFALAMLLAEVEALRAEKESLKQRVAELEVKESLWRKPSPTV
jgi:ubiquinone biosynthesis protein UbiJ